MHWTGKRVVVTGAGGFIGSHLVGELISAGADVTAVVRYNSRNDDGNLSELPDPIREQMRVIRIELTDPDAVRQAISGIDTVFHLAAFVGIPYSYTNPQDVITNNILSTLNLLVASRDAGVRRFVQTSTSEVYGSARSIPISETHVLQPQSPYSASKISTDSIAMSFWHTYQLAVCIVRPFNTFGPRQSARAIIPSVICQALAGGDVRVGSTDTTRDFTYVSDTVRGFIMAAQSDSAIGEATNIGTGREISIDTAIRLIVAITGGSAKIVQDESRVRPATSEVSRLCADVQKAKRILGFASEIGFEAGLRATVDWIREHPGRFKPASYNV